MPAVSQLFHATITCAPPFSFNNPETDLNMQKAVKKFIKDEKNLQRYIMVSEYGTNLRKHYHFFFAYVEKLYRQDNVKRKLAKFIEHVPTYTSTRHSLKVSTKQSKRGDEVCIVGGYLQKELSSVEAKDETLTGKIILCSYEPDEIARLKKEYKQKYEKIFSKKVGHRGVHDMVTIYLSYCLQEKLNPEDFAPNLVKIMTKEDREDFTAVMNAKTYNNFKNQVYFRTGNAQMLLQRIERLELYD